MSANSFQLGKSAAQIYEDQKVAAMFRPLAVATLDAVELGANDTILDLACGTGIVSRVIRERLGDGPRIIGADLNEAMVATARKTIAPLPGKFEFHVADVAKMSFADAAFSVVLCQQGIQFFPDKPAALSEIRRVLIPAGRFILTVWAGGNAFSRALSDALSRHVSAKIAAQSLIPFSYRGDQELPPLLKAAGFSEPQVTTLTIERIITDPEVNVPREILSNPVGPAVEKLGPKVMRAIVRDFIATSVEFQQGDRLVIPQTAHLIAATAI